jgi:DNA phosphorothioation-dependent restriction protein DptG
MPNHIHALIGFQNSGQSINTIVGNGKRFMAYQIVERLKERNEDRLLQQLQEAVEEKDKQRNKLHEVWSDSFDWKDCRGQGFIKQKLDYIHKNPVVAGMVGNPEEYLYSSAGNYAKSPENVLEVMLI